MGKSLAELKEDMLHVKGNWLFRKTYNFNGLER